MKAMISLGHRCQFLDLLQVSLVLYQVDQPMLDFSADLRHRYTHFVAFSVKLAERRLECEADV